MLSRGSRLPPWQIRLARRIRDALDRMSAPFSLIPNDAMLDVRSFPWTASLRENWEAIRGEALAAASLHGDRIDANIAPPPPNARARSLWEGGVSVGVHHDCAPNTADLLSRVPGLDSACFSILPPGAHLPPHRGLTKGLVTCHLALVVPREGDVRMHLRDRVVRWAEGETLVFDDTCRHEIRNETDGAHILLILRFRRPLRQPGRWMADGLLAMLRKYPSLLRVDARMAPRTHIAAPNAPSRP